VSRKETCEEITGLGVKGKKRKSRPSSFDFFNVHVFLFLIFCSLFFFFWSFCFQEQDSCETGDQCGLRSMWRER
jgi:hypothetical protein